VTPFIASLVFFPILTISTSEAPAQPEGDAQAFTPAPARVTQPINDQVRATLRGNIHPLARSEFDRGTAPDGQPTRRMLLVLKRSPQQEAALRKLLDEQQIKSSPNYHHWLTPQEFGEQFGPADSDIQAVVAWLASNGFEVARVSAGKTLIEFSGTAGAVRQALHTEIHRYSVIGGEYWANAGDPEIPAALAPVVSGIVSLNNFPRKSFLHTLGVFGRSKETGKIEPLYTATAQNGTTYYVVGPTDFATIYNVLPLWNAGIDGTGQTIAIVGESNINLEDDAAFRSMWSLPAKAPQIILDGPDPGLQLDETEADVDTQWSGAVAKGATIDLLVSQTTETTAGVDLSALYIIDNNLAPVMSDSYGSCEEDLGAAGNAFYNTLWQQGAAQGITVIVSSGDSGSDVCDSGLAQNWSTHGLSVSGTASTPFNVAVGGTDFNDAGMQSTYWSSTNNSTNGASAKSYIPESTWNNSCASLGLNGCVSILGPDLEAGSGGQSNCSQFNADGRCAGGYAKPAWQSGTGVPNDGVRDLPDLSLYAAAGSYSHSGYPICQSDIMQGMACSLNAFLLGGGTSVSAPIFAGIMAMVVQKTGQRQGNADYVLYPLAAQSGASCTSDATAISKNSCVFYDTVTGNNSVACAAGTPNCSNTTNSGWGILVVDPTASPQVPAWITTAGYDLATGLGSVNAADLVNNWSSVSFTPTTTSLTLATNPPTTPPTTTHGQPMNVSITVTPVPNPPPGTATGAVSLIAATSNGNLGIPLKPSTLTGGTVSATTDFLPGGTYNVTANYAGDGTFGASDSTPPIQVTVSPEPSATKISMVTFDPNTGTVINSNASTAVYGAPYLLRMDVTNASGNLCAPQSAIPQYPCPTGKATVTDNGAPLDAGTYVLNSQGYTEDLKAQLTGGNHALTANYKGDNSYSSSTGNDSILITQASTRLSTPLVAGPSQFPVNSQITVSTVVSLTSQGFGAPPTGTVAFYSDGNQLSGNVVLNPAQQAPGFVCPCLQASVNTSLSTSGVHVLTATYSGDTNYTGSTSVGQNVDACFTPTVSVTVSPSIVLASASVTATALVDTNNQNLPPTGLVTFQGDFEGGNEMYLVATTDPRGNSAGTASLTFAAIASGPIGAYYQGDANYFISQSPSVPLFVFPAGTGPDFITQAGSTTLTVTAPGQSATTGLTVVPSPGTNARVALTCALPSTMTESTCTISPSSVQLTDQQISTSQVTITTTGPHTVASLGRRPNPFHPGGGEIVFACLALLLIPVLKRRPSLVISALLLTVLIAGSLSCGGGGGSGGGGGGPVTDPGTQPGTYSVTVTGTATINGASVSHNLTITVNVQ